MPLSDDRSRFPADAARTAPPQRPVTLKVIAARVGYSKNTVSLALRGSPQIPGRTRERIRAVATEMGYQANAVMSQLMAHLRTSQTGRFRGKFALLKAGASWKSFDEQPDAKRIVAGCIERAATLGYSFDPFWLADPDLSADRWLGILGTRGIQGIVLAGLGPDDVVPERLSAVWQRLPTVIAGACPRDSEISYATVDHHRLVSDAVARVLARGFRAPGLVIDEATDRFADHRYTAGMRAAQESLPRDRRVPAFPADPRGRVESLRFRAWIDKHRPDAVLARPETALGCRLDCESAGVGIVSLGLPVDRPELAGMDAHEDLVGEAAVDMLVDQIHRRAAGAPPRVRGLLIPATWRDGTALRTPDATVGNLAVRARRNGQRHPAPVTAECLIAG